MMTRPKLPWQVVLGGALVTLSAVFYGLHYFIFRDVHHIFLYLVGDFAFVFIEVLMVAIILQRLLDYHDKQQMLKKLNMVIGIFFSEVGTELLRRFKGFDPGIGSITGNLLVTSEWRKRDFTRSVRVMRAYECEVRVEAGDLANLKTFLSGKRGFLLNLLGNANLLEHGAFTNLLWAIFHLTEELTCRQDLPDPDRKHLAGDILRAYRQLIVQWLMYLRHLKEDYPYLFSLALRTNPFDIRASVIIH